jgi:hypothetical protein
MIESYPFQPDVKINRTGKFYRKVQYAVQNNENYETYDTGEKEKTMYTGIAGNESRKNSDFPTCVTLKVGSEILIGIKVEGCIRIRIGINTMPVHNTAYWL